MDALCSFCVAMAHGNPGAITVLAGLVQRDRTQLIHVLSDALGLRGASIWTLWSDVCNSDANTFDALLYQLSHVKTIEDQSRGCPHLHTLVWQAPAAIGDGYAEAGVQL